MITVLIADGSLMVRKALATLLSSDPEICVLATAPDPYVARDLIVKHSPDVLLLDVEMPRMDGVTFVRKVMRYHPVPIVMICTDPSGTNLLALEALDAGAVAVIGMGDGCCDAEDGSTQLIETVKAASAVDVGRVRQNLLTTHTPSQRFGNTLENLADQVVAIGASTGGTVALEEILQALPSNSPGVIITQHMPEVFTRAFAQRLNGVCALEVKEASDGDVVEPGIVLIAPGNKHLVLRRGGRRYYVHVKHGPLVNWHRPSVDVMFRSVASCAGDRAVGVLLTGMGTDGARGLLEMKQAGAYTIAQDEASCVVYGMPRAAVELGAVERVVSIDRVVEEIMRVVAERATRGRATR